MKNPYVQVLMTYVRRPFSTVQAWLMTFTALLALAPMFISIGFAHEPPLISFFLPLAYVLGYLALHIKEQFSTPLAQSLPSYRRVHLVVAAILVVFFAILLPMGIASICGASPLGISAVVLACFSLLLWASIRPLVFYLLFPLWIFFVVVPSGETIMQQLTAGQYPAVSACFFAAGVALLVYCALLLWRLNEEVSGYHSWWQGNAYNINVWAENARKIDRFPDQKDKRWIGKWMEQWDTALRLWHVQRASGSWWSQVCRWPMGVNPRPFLIFWSVIGILYVQGLTLFLPSIAPMLVGMLLLTVGGYPLKQLQQRLRLVEYELSLPIDRVSYLRQVGIAAVLGWLQMWGCLAMALGLWWYGTTWGAENVPIILRTIIATGCCQIAMLGITLWMARYRSPILTNLVLITGVMGAFFLFTFFIPAHAGSLPPPDVTWPLVWIAAGLAVVGFALIGDAYRRWLNADLA
jgi:hypothetical protein